MKPPPKRGPDFGHIFYIGGRIVSLSAIATMQPAAPARYVIESPRSIEHQVRWDAEHARWTDQLSDEDHGDQEKTSDLPQAGSLPASSSPIEQSGDVHAPSDADDGLQATSRLCSSTRANNPRNKEGRSSDRPARITSPKAKADPEHTFFGRARVASVEAQADGRLKAPYRKDVELAPDIQALHKRLDRTRENRKADPEAYLDAIAAVDQADPLFYRGRYHSLEILPRYAPPESIDFARISAEMAAALTDLEEAA